MHGTDRKLRVFLCHSSQDKPVVRELYERLNAEGWIEPWLDKEKLLPGQDWDMEIKEAVRTAELVVVCLSSESILKEGYLQKEMRFVLDVADEKPEGMIFVVPVRLNDCPVPKRLAHWQWVDYFPQSRQAWAYDQLLNSLSVKANMLGIQIDVTQGNLSRDVRFQELLDADIVGVSATLDIESALNQISEAAKSVLRARFVYIFLSLDGKVDQTAYAGVAPKIVNYLARGQDGKRLLQSFANSTHATRISNICTLDAEIELDDVNLRSFIAVPLRLHRLSIGSILAFGKDGGVSFSEADEILSSYISIQACAAIEANWLSQELRGSLRSNAILYRLSTQIIQSETLRNVVTRLAEAAQKLSDADSGGIILLGVDKENELQVGFDANGIYFGIQPPADIVKQAMVSKQDIFVSSGQQFEACFPLQSVNQQYGAFWLKFSTEQRFPNADMANIKTLVNLATQAVERQVLLMENRLKTKSVNK